MPTIRNYELVTEIESSAPPTISPVEVGDAIASTDALSLQGLTNLGLAGGTGLLGAVADLAALKAISADTLALIQDGALILKKDSKQIFKYVVSSSLTANDFNVVVPTHAGGNRWVAIEDPKYVETTSGRAVLDSDDLILTDTTGGNQTFTLPTAVGRKGVIYGFKKIDASANSVILNTTGGQTIDGAASFSFTETNRVLQVISDDSNYYIYNLAAGDLTQYPLLNGTRPFTGSQSFQAGLKVSDGSAASPSLSFISDTNTGFYRVTTDRIGIANGGVFNGAFNADGSVGFGVSATTADQHQLITDLGSFSFTATTQSLVNLLLRVRANTGKGAFITFVENAVGNKWDIGFDAGDTNLKIKLGNNSGTGTLLYSFSNVGNIDFGSASLSTASHVLRTDRGATSFKGSVSSAINYLIGMRSLNSFGQYLSFIEDSFANNWDIGCDAGSSNLNFRVGSGDGTGTISTFINRTSKVWTFNFAPAFTAAANLSQIATPASPSSSTNNIYAKSDHELYNQSPAQEYIIYAGRSLEIASTVSGALSITGGTQVTIPYQTLNDDKPSGSYNTTTGIYTVPSDDPGYYFVTASIGFTVTAGTLDATKIWGMSLFNNITGSYVRYHERVFVLPQTTGVTHQVEISGLVKANGGNGIYATAFVTAGISGTVATSAHASKITIVKVRGL